MAKKIVRGITDVKTINNQDFDTNNVNDLLSDGQYNYIHRKKGENEEYHNLTDNIKTISSDNTELLSVTNNNKTTNTATLHPKHDKQKEQVIESTRNTIAIQHGENGTAEKTTVDVNFDKVQAKLTAGDGITIQGNTISATGSATPVEGATVSIRNFYTPGDKSSTMKQVVTNGYHTFTTFSVVCYDIGEFVLTGELKEELKLFIPHNVTVSNGAISIKNDGTTMKLINSEQSNAAHQHGTFTFYKYTGGGGGGTVS